MLHMAGALRSVQGNMLHLIRLDCSGGVDVFSALLPHYTYGESHC